MDNKLFNRTYEDLINRRKRLLSGKINCIPWNLPRFEEESPGIEQGKSYLATASSKIGKCFAKDTKVIKYDGSIISVQDIKNGDLLMGPDSSPRLVQGTTNGVEKMYKIKQKWAKDYIVNESHILHLYNISSNTKVNITVKDYNLLPKTVKNNYKSISSNAIEFNKKVTLEIDPYFYGLWLGDGNRSDTGITNIDPEIIDYIYETAKINNCYVYKRGITYYLTTQPLLKSIDKNGKIQYYKGTEDLKQIYDNNNLTYIYTAARNNTISNGKKWKWINRIGDFWSKFNKVADKSKRHINKDYIYSSIKDRFSLLAGFIDADGYKSPTVNRYSICQKHKSLLEDIIFIARSVGLCAYFTKTKIVNGVPYYRITIKGDNCKYIPCLIPRKQFVESQYSKSSYSEFNITEEVEGEYYGFQVNKDHLFLLSDFTVVHNSQITNWLFVFNPIRQIIDEGLDVKLKIFYFSLEMTSGELMRSIFSNILYLKEGVRVSPKDLRSTKKDAPVSPEILELIIKYKPYFDKIEEIVTFIDDIRHPTGINAVLETYARKNGTIQYKKINIDGEEHDTFDHYTPNNPDEYVMCIVDHIGLISEEKQQGRQLSLRESISLLSSKYFVRLRNRYNYIPVVIQQQAAA